MDEPTNGGGSAEPQDLTIETNEAWRRLQVGLAEQLGNMTDDGDHLVMELPFGGDRGEVGTTPYAQFAGSGDGMVRAELSGDAYLAPLHRLDAEAASSLSLGGWLGNDGEELNWYLERSVADANLVALTVVWACATYSGSHTRSCSATAPGGPTRSPPSRSGSSPPINSRSSRRSTK